MPGWENSSRRDRLPPNWAQIREDVLAGAGFRCQQRMPDGSLCSRIANEVDHKVRGDDHRPENLRAVCSWHHQKKSSSEGGRANWAIRKSHLNRHRDRRVERHPGIL